MPKIVLVGNPNVGKSSLFNSLSGSYTVVSNYPGTSVEISRGKGRTGEKEYEIIDTPGMYSLLPVSEEERVSQRLLFEETPFVCLHVVDARNLRRMLSLTLQLLEAELPLILVLNMMDEAEERGVEIDSRKLSQLLGVPVVGTVSNEGKGIKELKAAIEEFSPSKTVKKIEYGAEIEPYLAEIGNLPETGGESRISTRALGALLLQEDKTALEWVCRDEKLTKEAGCPEKSFSRLQQLTEEASRKAGAPLHYLIALKRQEYVNEIVEQVMTFSGTKNETGKEKEEEEEEIYGPLTGKAKHGAKKLMLAEKVDSILTHPVLGIPVLLLVLYFGLYRFVGVFAAGTVVDFLENTVFGEHINPWITSRFTALVPFPLLQDLFVGEYGIITQAATYAIALILPIVGAFFLVFSIIEDTGYLPRLGLLVDGMFKKIGLSGRAVIPMVLGFGCSTMATMVTRTLETKRERLIANLLLALAIPCSAQLGIILSVLSGSPRALLAWAGVICLEFVLIGYLASKVLPGRNPTFILELPPLRWPKLSNIAVKTYSRMHWYFLEVLPLFVLASVLIWIGRLTGLFALALKVMEYPTLWIGLPPDAAVVFLFGFFRRDFGAAGLYGMYDSGALTAVQLLVAAVTLTLFMPCIAQFMMTVKERGLKTALAISAFIFPFAFLSGYMVSTLLAALGVSM
ncbi:ferrous iron transport protein B [Methanosarcina sp. KYL-1]|uniref:ferrous iron transport protein B n=1 Tax=Methanosarcina sp. KYL-1 TaxID=2602068 RepID=UPI0021015C5E|nr:ferrous iron transport protein B [Methanosarcina sp. KYL-1]MCQ1534741.1 ferrous iron transport protein B [Methanosarcina sp. KYL-1]